MPVKHWSAAGLVLTYWCNARCASCYLCCGPEDHAWMSADDAIEHWRQLASASPHGCRVHLTGGEPFGNWPLLIEVARRAKAEGLGPLDKVETNAFWADDEGEARQRLAALDEAGMRRLTISADPYHQQFVPIDRCRLLAAAAVEVLGPGRVQVRWPDWLEHGFDTAAMSPQDREALFVRYATQGRDRLNGRAAGLLAGHPQQKTLKELADENCREPLLRSRHVHIDPDGLVMPGTCAGIVLGIAGPETIQAIWSSLDRDHADRPVVGALAARGPVGLLEMGLVAGYSPRESYAGKCQLCWEIRGRLAAGGLHDGELSPRWMYGVCPCGGNLDARVGQT